MSIHVGTLYGSRVMSLQRDKKLCLLPMIQDRMGMLYPPRGPLSLNAPWLCTYLQASENAGWTQRFTGTFLQALPKGSPLNVLIVDSLTTDDA